MTVIAAFLDRELAADARYGGRMDLDECPPSPPALDRYLRSRARHSAARLRINRELRALCTGRPAFLRLLAYEYAGMPGYRPSWEPAFAGGEVPPGPLSDLLLERWRDEERLAREAAEEAGLDFAWREVDRQDGQGLVIDGEGRPLWNTAVHPEDGFAIARHGPGRALRGLAAGREILGTLDPAAGTDRTVLNLLAEPYTTDG
ncbi:hypothetical protein [Actinomadura fibrosa]|uniref:Uncharacterized protein n=1 Tax=Actinomadura fibrosa TaxID=111802 RepID=A0ABW2XPW8_9ACTN|nr:hypothetical protein [Actinomadura fibrosa]